MANMDEPTPRVLLVDDDPVFLKMMGDSLAECPQVDLVARSASGLEALRYLTTHRVDIVLLDIDMPDQDGISTAQTIKQRWPKTRVLMLTAFAHEQDLGRSLAAGACGFITKDATPEQLVRTILRAVDGESVLSSRPANLLMDAYKAHATNMPADEQFARSVETLPPYLKDVSFLVAEAASNKEISRRLHLAASTVREYLSELLRRTSCSSRVEMAIKLARLHDRATQ